MECYCSSKTLYSPFNEDKSFKIKSEFHLHESSIISKRESLKPLPNPLESKNLQIFKKAFDISSISFSPEITKIDFNEIEADPLFFHREFVSKNFPCIITNAIDSWEALETWQDPNYLIERLGEKQITVDLTPDGFADSIKNKYFIEPFQIQMNMKQFLQLQDKDDKKIGYIQKQNDNLNSEFSLFFNKDIDLGLREFFGKKIFNKPADACNFWMGKNPSVSSLHKDHYENIYAVITGEKHFSLIPPICYPSLYEGEYIHTKWNLDQEKNEFFIQENLENFTKWLSINPDLEEDRMKFQALKDEELCKIFHCVVEAGEILYLPSLWFHQVSQFNKNQENYTRAVNFWFDMEFGNNFALLETLKSLIQN